MCLCSLSVCMSVFVSLRVTTNLENLEYSWISLNVENAGISQGILCNLREKL